MSSSNMIELSDLYRPAQRISHSGPYLSAAQINEAMQNRRYLMPSTNGYNVNMRANLSPFQMLAIGGGSPSPLSDMSGERSRKLYFAALQAEADRLKQEAADREAAEAEARADAERKRREEAERRDAEQQAAQYALYQQAQAQAQALESQRQAQEQQAAIRQAALSEQERRNQQRFEQMQRQQQLQFQDQMAAQKTYDLQKDASRWLQQQQDQMLANSRQVQALQSQLSQAQSASTIAAAPAAPVMVAAPGGGSGAPLPPEIPSAPAPWSLPSFSPTTYDQVQADGGSYASAPVPSWELPANVEGGIPGAGSFGGTQSFEDSVGMADLPSNGAKMNSGLRNVLALSLGTIAVLALAKMVQ